MIEATIDPHKSVATRYQAKTIITEDGQQITGLVVDEKNSPYVVMTSDGQFVKVERDEVEDIRKSKLSHMPEGLLNELSLSQVADLFAYLVKGPRTNLASRSSSRASMPR